MGEFEKIGRQLWCVVACVVPVTTLAVWLVERTGENPLVAFVVALSFIATCATVLCGIAAMLWALIAPVVRWLKKRGGAR